MKLLQQNSYSTGLHFWYKFSSFISLFSLFFDTIYIYLRKNSYLNKKLFYSFLKLNWVFKAIAAFGEKINRENITIRTFATS